MPARLALWRPYTTIAREIVLAHGGTLDVASSEATGTTFTVRLPRDAPPSKATLGITSE